MSIVASKTPQPPESRQAMAPLTPPASLPIPAAPLTPPSDATPPLFFGGNRTVVPAAAPGDMLPHADDAHSVKSDEAGGLGKAAPAGKFSVEVAPESSSVQASIEKLDNGEPVLVVQAAWKELRRPSLQVMLVTDPKADLAKFQPIAIDGVRAQTLWEEQLGKINKPVFPNARDVLKTSTAFLEYNGSQWVRVRSRINSLGCPAAYAVEDKQGLLLVFFLLDRWSDRQGAIRIALPDLDVASNFAQPGRLKIWLLNEEKPVATVATVTWPGKPSPAVASQPGDKKDKPTPTDTKPDVAKTSPPATGGAKTPPAPTTKPRPGSTASVATSGKATAAPQKSEPPKTDTKPAPVPSATKPAATTPPKPAGPPTLAELQAMSIPDLANSIERVYGSQMSAAVRKNWQGGINYYFQSPNPEAVRRDVLMTLVRVCWKEQQPGDLRNAFAVLYLKLKGQPAP